MTVKEFAEKCGCSRTWIYKMAKRLGRLPTYEEVMSRKGKQGKPIKTKYKDIEEQN